MSDRRGVALGVASAAPIGLCAIAAAAMTAAGDPRVLAIDLALPGAVLIAGALVSAVPAFMLVVHRQRRRESARVQAAVADAAAQATQQERANHQRFLSRLDHELKNPLTAIRATAAAAQSDSALDEWRVIDTQATKLSALVRDLRKLAELETRALDLEVVDLEQLLTEAMAALSIQNPAAGARMSLAVTRVPWPVPPLTADLDLLSLAIDNVLANAAKYSAHGPIEVRLREQDGWAVIDIADAGRGIPAADLPTVFDELARAQNARDVTGSGIGLTLVATIMRRHGGDVSIRSAEGAGTVLTLRLPIRR
ncbi:Sensor histidine kinase WalK [Microbacterium oxydans]|uniref:Sensor-like histidine kinase SenX3 n=1 Tax=Microbacterium oxydans TaxID=82380 RepID=A0A0F0LMB6_9MICO|nr:HAMP domain-containing sensor histidine kinase [Microbacterium oxydans]KJL34367.1 Sensor histidine kinase YycG [Microbacterium oxydans]CAH0261367.1 Sensor histidine kinase WalK [Microbacterium oxydans]